MPRPDERIQVVREWIEKAESDFTAATHLIRMGEGCPTDAVGFHAEQCVEKYLKASLVLKDVDFPKTHDIPKLVSLLAGKVGVTLSIEDQQRLTSYATVTRYPGDYEPISLTEARRAVGIARRARREIRKELPKESLR